ncbi:MAG: response regulator, partial [Oscillospiraceae bacterium]
QAAWDYFSSLSPEEKLTKVDCIITDIEMPRMDGHRLTRLVKEDANLKHIPLIIFSSLINEEMHIKGVQLGADAQLTKPEIGNLVHVIDKLLLKEK